MIVEASLFDRLEDKTVQCRVCAHQCTIRSGKRGICGVRENRDGKLYSMNSVSYTHLTLPTTPYV